MGRGRRIAVALLPVLLIGYAVAYSFRSGASDRLWIGATVAFVLAGLSLYGFARLPVAPVALAVVAWEVSGSAVFIIAVSYLLGRRRPTLWWAYVFVLAVLHPLGLAPAPQVFAAGHALLPNEAVPLYACLTPALIGVGVWASVRNLELARERTALIEDAADARAAAAVSADRLRISRELHDLLGQRLSSVALRAAVLTMRAEDPELRSIAEAIAATSAESIEDLHFVIRMMRRDASVHEPHRSRSVEDAIAVTRATGVTVRADLTANEGTLHDDQRLLIIAVLEETLHNAVKHAPGAGIDVCTSFPEPGRFELTVRNGPPLGVVPRLPTGGFGLVGAAERAAELGAQLDVAGTDDGGFGVRLVVPA
jgi:signal transduction histidine kinase